MTDLITNPEHVKLREEVRSMRNKIVQLLQERDRLLLVECKGIEARYMALVGALECEAFREEVAYRRAKRKMEMLQALFNRGEHAPEWKIEELLDEEMAQYQQRLDDRMEKLNQMVSSGGAGGFPAATEEELRKVYHKVVKALHPDLNPDLSDQEIELFQWAQNAYENRDLATLKTIADALRTDRDLPEDMTRGDLIRERERLVEIASDIRGSIAKIKSEYPYTMKDLINDEEWVQQRREELQQQIDDFIKIRKTYEERIKEMLAVQRG